MKSVEKRIIDFSETQDYIFSVYRGTIPRNLELPKGHSGVYYYLLSLAGENDCKRIAKACSFDLEILEYCIDKKIKPCTVGLLPCVKYEIIPGLGFLGDEIWFRFDKPYKC